MRTVWLRFSVSILLTIVVISGILLLSHPERLNKLTITKEDGHSTEGLWKAPDSTTMPMEKLGKEIRYGKKLIANTARYLGPKGSVLQISNGMNCQNCHLNAGTKPFGNNYGSVASMYPRFRARSGSLESIEKRVNDCIERSLNGKKLDSLSMEMKSMVAYIKWVGKDLPKGRKAKGSGLFDIAYLPRRADTLTGRSLYASKCAICHGYKGEGLRRMDGVDYVYPPLWGENSFNVSAGLFRISNFANYIFTNMPQGATYDKPVLTEVEAWDIAAYVVSRPRPAKKFEADWPKIETKPVDYPFGPYADTFTDAQHKYGPFQPILESLK